jgi:Tol biopolymer transport system component
MTDDLSFERMARDWLELGPVVAPDDIVHAALFEIQTTTQERDLRVPWRFPTMQRIAIVAAAAAIAALLGIGVFFAGSIRPAPTPAPTAAPAAIASLGPSATAASSPRPTLDTSPLSGRILVEHFGNAPDGSETNTGADVHRLYLADPNNMTASGMTELLPGTPTTGKLSADVSPDGSRVVFEDWADPSSIYIVGIDGNGFRKVTPAGCACSEWDPAFDPTGRRIVYGHASGGHAWLEVRDLATGATTKLAATEGPASDAVPEAPSWSPDGTRIAFVRLTWNGVPPSMGRVHYHTGVPTADVLDVVTVATGSIAHLPTPGELPGDPAWSPDGSLIVFTNGPTTIFDDSGTTHEVYTVHPDGSGIAQVVLGSGGRGVLQGDSANFTPDGRILSTFNVFTLVRPDGSGYRPVDPNAMDNTENNVGYVYVGHWVGTP